MAGIGIDIIAEAGEDRIAHVIDRLIERGQCDQKAIERAVRVARALAYAKVSRS